MGSSGAEQFAVDWMKLTCCSMMCDAKMCIPFLVWSGTGINSLRPVAAESMDIVGNRSLYVSCIV